MLPLAEYYSDVAADVGQLSDDTRAPVVYSPQYNISFFGLERLHPFDPCKFGKIVSNLKHQKLITKVGQV